MRVEQRDGGDIDIDIKAMEGMHHENNGECNDDNDDDGDGDDNGDGSSAACTLQAPSRDLRTSTRYRIRDTCTFPEPEH